MPPELFTDFCSNCSACCSPLPRNEAPPVSDVMTSILYGSAASAGSAQAQMSNVADSRIMVSSSCFWPRASLLRRVQVVILEVLGALDGRFQRQPVLRELIELGSRRDADGALDRAAVLAGFRDRIGVASRLPAVLDEVVQGLLRLEDEDAAEVLDSQAEPDPAREHLHVHVASGLVVMRHARAARNGHEYQVHAEVREYRVAVGAADL